jgi:hypothetical protein
MKSHSRKLKPFIQSRNAVVRVFFLTLLLACTYDRVGAEIKEKPEMAYPVTVLIEACADRTGTQQIDPGLQVPKTTEEQFDAAKEFVVQPDGRYILHCEITSYLPDNAAKRWVMPIWDSTVGRVSSMLQDRQTSESLIIVKGEAAADAGGLLTIDAEQYLVPAAVKEEAGQLMTWVRVELPEADKQYRISDSPIVGQTYGSAGEILNWHDEDRDGKADRVCAYLYSQDLGRMVTIRCEIIDDKEADVDKMGPEREK